MREHHDEAWLTGLYEQHGAAIHAYARRRVASAEDAEDVVVEVFATAWRRRHDVPEEPLPWLYATASNMVAHTVRGQSRRQRVGARLAVVRPAEVHVPDPAEQVVDSEAVAQALRQLPPADAELLRLWAWEHLEPAQVAEVLGISAGTARTRLHRARTRLREALLQLGMAGPWADPETGDRTGTER